MPAMNNKPFTNELFNNEYIIIKKMIKKGDINDKNLNTFDKDIVIAIGLTNILFNYIYQT